jgi:sugar lactone lactonase YvrE
MSYRKEKILGGRGTSPHQFLHSLTGIALDQNDNLYAVGDSAVKVFDSDGGFLKSWSTSQPGWSVATDEQEVFVGEEGQIEVFDLSGELQRTWRNAELLGRVTAIDFLEDQIIVADSLARCLRRFKSDGSFLNSIGHENRMRGFNIPNGSLDFAVDWEGIIHACNPGKHRVERYTREGELLGHIGRFDGRDPEGFPGCCNPTNVTVTEQGKVYVTEKAGPRAKVLDLEGNLISVIAASAFDPNCKNMDVAVDSKGRVYVVDTIRLQVHVFAPGQAEREG